MHWHGWEQAVHRCLAMATVVLCLCAAALAQEQEGDLVYRFTVQGVADRETAKPVQHAMLEHVSVHACEYLQECQCFKMATPAALTYGQLRAMLMATGFVLTGTVTVSDGTVLTPITTIAEDQ